MTTRRLPIRNAILVTLTAVGLSCTSETPRYTSSYPKGVAFVADPMTDAGVPIELADWRRSVIESVDYALTLGLTPGADAFRATCNLTVTLREDVATLPIDFRGRAIHAVTVNGAPQDVARAPDRIVVAADDLRRGPNTITIDYTAGIGAAGEGLIRVRDAEDGAEYLYTLNVPADGHAVFPCFDQPDLKARFTLDVTTPETWRVVANAPLEREDHDGGRVRRRFAPTLPIPTYLFAFAAGPFHAVTGGTPGATAPAERPLRFFGRASQRELLAEHAPEILRLHRTALAWLERYFDAPYPFAKFDFVCVPDFPFGGMEHPGCIFYGEDPMLFRTEVTRLREARRADLISHETAHMWFGDDVTMPWFDDVWLKEGFATFMAHKVLEATFGGIDHSRGFFLRNVVAALDTDLTRGAAPIRRPLANLADAKSNYGPIIYRKGPAVLRQLEDMMGADRFREATRTFLRDHALACGDWPDLLAALSAAAAPEQRAIIDSWSKSWIEAPGAPRVRTRILERLPASTRIELRQEDPTGGDRTWPLVTSVAGYRGGTPSAPSRVQTTDATATCKIPIADAEWVFGNPRGVTYASFVLDEASREAVLAHWTEIDEPLLRARLWEALWADVQRARLSPEAWLAHAREHAAAEDDERLFGMLLARMTTAIERYIVDRAVSDRECAAAEAMVLSFVRDTHRPKGHRLIALRAMFDLAWTDEGAAFLRALLDERERLEGIELADRDRWAMVRRLVLIGDGDAERQLARMKERDTSDDARRQAFLVECARPDADSKRALFRRFREDRELPERWVQNALPTFWHSRHAALTDSLLVLALQQLDWIKKNRKVFFLPAWVNAAVRSRLDHKSAAIAEEYVERPDTQPDVRLKTLVPLDHLRRTLAIRAGR